MKKWLITCLTFALLAFINQAGAENLLQAYQQALISDPTFKEADAQMRSQKELLPISRSYLLPNIGGSAGISRNRISNTAGFPSSNTNTIFYDTNKQYGVSLRQPLFNFAAWAGFKAASATVKSAVATYNAAAQDLIIRVATNYFDVLEANDELRNTQAEKRSLAQQLNQAQERYKVGLIAITGVQQIQAEYDATVALEIADKNNLSDKLEELRAITGNYYSIISGLTAKLPLVTPQPTDINAWVTVASHQNYALQAANYAAEAALQVVHAQFAGHLPSVAATGGYTYNNDDNPSANGTFDTKKTASIGIAVNLPIYQGGLVTAQTRQASYNYAAASAQAEGIFRTTVTGTREAYLGVLSYISKIKADKQAIISNESALRATQAAYMVGTNTIVDVLEQQSKLYDAQRQLYKDQYQYLINTLKLKQAAGTLSVEDLTLINSWLGSTIHFTDQDMDTNVSKTKQPQSKIAHNKADNTQHA